MKIIWLASYPRSGNTYLRFLLYNYLYGEIQDSMQVQRVMPDLHKVLQKKRHIKVEKKINILCKTHFIYWDKHPYIEHTAGVIYILRNPRDLLVSHLRFYNLLAKRETDETKFAKSFIRNLGVVRGPKMKWGTWPGHIASWINVTSKYPMLFIRYEDLRLNTPATFKRVLEFLKQKVDEEKVRNSIEQCSIESMRALEKSEKSKTKPTLFDGEKADQAFMGEGKINQSLDFLGEGIEERFTNRFGKIMGVFGY